MFGNTHDQLPQLFRHVVGFVGLRAYFLGARQLSIWRWNVWQAFLLILHKKVITAKPPGGICFFQAVHCRFNKNGSDNVEHAEDHNHHAWEAEHNFSTEKIHRLCRAVCPGGVRGQQVQKRAIVLTKAQTHTVASIRSYVLTSYLAESSIYPDMTYVLIFLTNIRACIVWRFMYSIWNILYL